MLPSRQTKIVFLKKKQVGHYRQTHLLSGMEAFDGNLFCLVGLVRPVTIDQKLVVHLQK